MKDWAFGHPRNLREDDAVWQDDRYDPTKYSHPHRYDNVNFPEQEYKDVFGGTMGNAAAALADKHKIGLLSNTSTAMMEHQSKARKDSLMGAAAAVDELNKKED